VFIGRKSDADMHLTDTLASRKHCIVEYRDGEFCVHDNASRTRARFRKATRFSSANR